MTAVGCLGNLSGRDDEIGFTGMWRSEPVGLEARYVRSADVHVEWQLYELDNGQPHR